MNYMLKSAVAGLVLSQNVFALSPVAAGPREVKLDVTKSELQWAGKKAIGSGHHGILKLKSGVLMLNNDKIVSGKFVIDMASIKDVDLTKEEDKQKLQGHLKSEDFFDVKNFPDALFEINKVEGAQVTGNLTMHGISHPVVLQANIKKSGKTWIATSVKPAELDRTKWNVKYGEGPKGSAFEKLEKKVKEKIISNEFTVAVNLTTVES